MNSAKTYTFVVQKDVETGLLVGHVPGFPGAHSQAATIDELKGNLREVIALLLEDGEPARKPICRDGNYNPSVMAKPPVLRAREVSGVLERLGFEVVRQRGPIPRILV